MPIRRRILWISYEAVDIIATKNNKAVSRREYGRQPCFALSMPLLGRLACSLFRSERTKIDATAYTVHGRAIACVFADACPSKEKKGENYVFGEPTIAHHGTLQTLSGGARCVRSKRGTRQDAALWRMRDGRGKPLGAGRISRRVDVRAVAELFGLVRQRHGMAKRNAVFVAGSPV